MSCKEPRSGENLSILLADSKEITRRTGCERHGFIRTYVRTGSSLLVEVSATQGFPLQGSIGHRKQGKRGMRGGRAAQAV